MFFIILKNNLANPLHNVTDKTINKFIRQTGATDDIDYAITTLLLITERKANHISKYSRVSKAVVRKLILPASNFITNKRFTTYLMIESQVK